MTDTGEPDNVWWSIDELTARLALALYGPKDVAEARVRMNAQRLRRLLVQVEADEDAIVGYEARALLAELDEDTKAAVTQRTRQHEQTAKLLATGFSDERCNSVSQRHLVRHIEWLRGLDSGYPLTVERRIVGR